MASWRLAAIVCLLVACEGRGATSGNASTPAVTPVADGIDLSTTSPTSSTDLVEATDLAPSSDATDVTSDTINPDLVPFWFFDFGVIGAPGLEVGDRPYYNFVTLGNAADTPIRLVDVTFPELPDGLVVRRTALYTEDRPELASPDDPFPVDAAPVADYVLEPTDGVVENVFEDARFVAVYVEVEVVAEGEWVIGPMDVTYEVDGGEHTRRVAENVGSACTTPRDVPCIPHLDP